METVSSSLTFLYKFIFTSVWSGGFGLGTVVIFLSRKLEAMRWQFAAAWAIGTAFLLLTCARLKRVKLDAKSAPQSEARYHYLQEGDAIRERGHFHAARVL